MSVAVHPAPLRGFYRLRGLVLAVGIAALFVLLRPSHALAQNSSCGEPQRSQESIVLERCVKRVFNNNGVEKKVIVYFTTTNGAAADRLSAVDADGNPANGAELGPDALAGYVADRTVDVWRLYRFYGFPDPQARNDMKVHIFDMRPGLLGWCCTDDEFQVEASHVLSSLRFGGDPRDLESVVYHEMWHASRWSPAFGCWAIEGGASHMTDHVTQPVDNDPTNDYMGRITGYLGGGHTTSLTDHCYLGALWWQYFSERTSSGTDTLKRGVDSVKAFWDDSAPTDFTRMDNVIRARAPGETFESLWIDFAVANYAKELTGPAGPAKYRYFDETHSLAPDYPPPSFDGSYVITPNQPLIPTLSNVNAWAAKYYLFTPSNSTPLINLEVRQDLNRRLAYSLLFVDNNAIVREERSVGRNFSVSVPNNGYDQLVLVVVGLNEPAAFRFSLNAAATLEIVDPLWARPVLVGRPNAPDKFLLKLNVFAGAGGEPMVGIDPNSFAISVGGVPIGPADRISAAFIQGQYWLLLRAPVQPADGAYELAVSYAGLSDRESQAIRYVARADAATMVVIDRSGSMNDFAKLQAAKDAARLYIDSWRTNDLIGVASFNEDATVNLPLGAFDAERNNALNAINGLAGGGDTSIGDGAQIAMQNLIDRDGSARPWSIMLLSDGLENREILIATFLANYNARANAKPAQKVPRVIAVALGPDADRARMENLANATGGVYYVAGLPVVAAEAVAAAPVAAAAGAPAALQPSATNAVRLSNDLAEIYRAGSEFLAGQHQIGAQSWPYNYDAIPQEFKFQVDGAASEVVFVVKWDSGTLPQDVLLRKPDGQLVVPTPAAQDSLHRLFRIAAPDAGEWGVVIDFANDLRLDGLPLPNELLVEASVSSDLALNAFLGLPVAQRLVGRPMPILASLSDSRPLPGAAVNAFVTAPGGFYNVILSDDGKHADGAAGDGFYGGTFYATQGHGGYDVVVTATGVGRTATRLSAACAWASTCCNRATLTSTRTFPLTIPTGRSTGTTPTTPTAASWTKTAMG